MESLCAQIITLRIQLQHSTANVEWLKEERRELRRENKAFREEHSRMCLIVNKYQAEMKTKLDALQTFGERLEVEQKMLVSGVPNVSNPQP